MPKIALPPAGTLIRDYVSLTLLLVASYHRDVMGDESVKCECGNLVEFEGTAENLCESLASAYRTVLEIIESRQVKAPKIHQNDAQVLIKGSKKAESVFKSLRETPPPTDANYVEVFKKLLEAELKLLENGQTCPEIIKDLATIKVKKNEIELGIDPCAPLQPFKLEKYEYGKDFMTLTGMKADIRASPHWLILVASGWLLSYMGLKGGYLTFSMPPPDLLDIGICSKKGEEQILNSYGLQDPVAMYSEFSPLNVPARIGSASVLPEAYQLLVGIESAKTSSAQGAMIRLMRVNYNGKTFTLVEDTMINLSPLVRFARNLIARESAGKAVSDLASCAVSGYSGRYSEYCKKRYGDLQNSVAMVSTLYKAVMGSIAPERAVYILSRLSPLGTEDFTPPFRRTKVLSWILKSLRM